MSQLVSVNFDGDEILCIRWDDGRIWISVRRVSEALGIDAKSQRERLQQEPWVVGGLLPLTAANGLTYSTYCIDLDCLPMWLATITSSRVAPHVRPKLQRYQTECARVLASHFFGRPTLLSPHPWSIRFRQTSASHLRYVNVYFPAGSWSVITAAAVHMLVLEDEIIRHMMEPSQEDRPDISVGLCWSHERRRRELGSSIGFAPLTLPNRRDPVEVNVYAADERAVFEEWFNHTYLPEKLSLYLERKPEFGKVYGSLPCASTADHTCQNLGWTTSSAQIAPSPIADGSRWVRPSRASIAILACT
jgi:hypothetical protein